MVKPGQVLSPRSAVARNLCQNQIQKKKGAGGLIDGQEFGLVNSPSFEFVGVQNDINSDCERTDMSEFQSISATVMYV